MAFSQLDTEVISFSGFDKIKHFSAFFVLTFFSHFSLQNRDFSNKTFIYKIFLPLLGYAIFIECVQYYLPNRYFSIFDIVADICGISIYLLVQSFFKKKVGKYLELS